MRSIRARWAAGAAWVLLAWVSAGCGGQQGIAGSARNDPNPLPADTMTTPMLEVGRHGGRFVIAQTSGPRTFNDIMANESSSTDVTGRMFVGLVDLDYASERDFPLLAKSWEVSPDGLTWIWHLRRGARFSDGHPITSEDVLFSMEVAQDEKLHPSVLDLLKVDGKKMEVSAPDSYTVVTRITRPYALMIHGVGAVKIMPKHRLEAAYRAGNFASAYNVSTAPESIVTSGPFVLKQYVAGEKTVLAPNPHWFGVDPRGRRLPYLDELVYLIVPDQETAALKFQTGEVDAVDNVKPADYAAYEDGQKKGNYTLHELGPAMNTNFFWVNQNTVKDPKPGKKVGQPYVDAVKYDWFTRREFRQALSKAVDREAMIKSVFFGEAIKNWSVSTPANKTWFTTDAGGLDYDPDGAKALIAGMGWKDRDGDGIVEDEKGRTVSFTMKTNGDNVTRVAMANFVRDDLAKIGIRCTPVPVDFNTLITNLRQDFNYESILLGLQSGVPPDPMMGQNVWKSSGLTHYWNVAQKKPSTEAEARIDQLIAECVGTNDLAARKRAWTEIQQIVNREAFFVWLPTIKLKLPVRNTIGNVQPAVIPHRILWNVDRIYHKGGGTPA
jgi:peptide/nickel transport system substrate-binding protein